MPILLHVNDLKPGLCLAQPVYFGDQRLICGGQTLEQWHIDGLRRRLPNSLVRVLDPILDEMADFEDDSQNTDVAATVTTRVGHMMGGVQAKLGSRTAMDGTDLAGVQRALTEVIGYLQDHPVTAAVLQHGTGQSSYLQEHAANVMYVSLLIGSTIREYVYQERARTTHARTLAVRYGMNLTPLALGCLFHDLGMIELRDVFGQTAPLSADQCKRLRSHPMTGADLLPPETDAVARMVVRTHHENMNGTGYPMGMPGSKLHVFSRIVRVADAFDAATSERTYRRAKTAAQVLWEITCGPTRQYYDPLIARILGGLVQPFPIGARIRLDCGRWGVVVRHNRRDPFRPTVIIAFDEDGQRLRKKDLSPPINLAENEEVRLFEFQGQELSFLNRGTQPLPEPDPAELLEELASDSMFDEVESGDLFSFAYP